MRVGVCTSVANLSHLLNVGLDYLEESVTGFLVPFDEESVFLANLERAHSLTVPIKAANELFSPGIKCVGPEADREFLVDYAHQVFYRAAHAGIELIAFDSPAAREIPEGVAPGQAFEDLVILLGQIAPLAEMYRVRLALEPINAGECNFINTLEDASCVLEAVRHPSLGLLANLYHMALQGEEPDDIEIYGHLIHHVHVAEFANRSCPGVGGEDFRPYLQAFRQCDYFDRISIDCLWGDMQQELPQGARFLRSQLVAVGY